MISVTYKGRPTHHFVAPNSDNGVLTVNNKHIGDETDIETLINDVLAVDPLPKGWPVRLMHYVDRHTYEHQALGAIGECSGELMAAATVKDSLKAEGIESHGSVQSTAPTSVVTIEKIDGKLGMSFAMSAEPAMSGPVVKKVVPGGAAMTSGLIKPGMPILGINGVSTLDMVKPDISAALSESNPVVLELGNPLGQSGGQEYGPRSSTPTAPQTAAAVPELSAKRPSAFVKKPRSSGKERRSVSFKDGTTEGVSVDIREYEKDTPPASDEEDLHDDHFPWLHPNDVLSGLMQTSKYADGTFIVWQGPEDPMSELPCYFVGVVHQGRLERYLAECGDDARYFLTYLTDNGEGEERGEVTGPRDPTGRLTEWFDIEDVIDGLANEPLPAGFPCQLLYSIDGASNELFALSVGDEAISEPQPGTSSSA